jgi:D-serine deaminase-like pyridoxal phosphate-dependent protein
MNASTPFLQIDASRVQRNLDRLAAYAAGHGLKVRPHSKTHKSRRLARMQLDAGAAGLTVAKVGEAAVMAEVCTDLLLAYPTVDWQRCQQVAALAASATMRVAIDSIEAAKALSSATVRSGTTVGLLIDLDVGMGRTGVPSPTAALELGQAADRLAGVRVDGLFCYPGQVWEPIEKQGPPLRRIADLVQEAVDLFQRHGLNIGTVSGGSTPTAYQSHFIPALTEIRPGTYIFNDMNTVRGGFCSLEDCAASIVCTVVSNAVRGQCVIDAGSKTLTSDPCIPDPNSGHGYIVEYPSARITHLSEEHAQIDITRCEQVPKLGARVTVIPNHICPCINLQDTIQWHDGTGKLEPLTIDARGKLS